MQSHTGKGGTSLNLRTRFPAFHEHTALIYLADSCELPHIQLQGMAILASLEAVHLQSRVGAIPDQITFEPCRHAEHIPDPHRRAGDVHVLRQTFTTFVMFRGTALEQPMDIYN